MALGKVWLVLAVLIVASFGGAFVLVHDRSARLADSLRKSITSRAADSSSTKSEDPILFNEMLLFDGTTEAGFRFTTQTYQSWDCMIVRKRIEFLDSPANAKSEFKKTLGLGAELLERGVKLDSIGQLIGERVVMRFAKDKKTPEISIVWTENSQLHSLDSSSLDHALRLEEWLKARSSRPASKQGGPSKDLVFEPTSTSNGVTSKGRPFSERLFRSNDCVTLSSRIEYFDSSGDAQKELRLRIKDAVEIVRNGLEVASNGQPTGDRTVAIFAPELPRELSHSAQVLWIENAELHTIKSNSLPHVLAFEKSLGK